MLKNALLATGFFLAIIVLCNRGQHKNFDLMPIRSDGAAYYEFLPAFLKYQDPWLLKVWSRPAAGFQQVVAFHSVPGQGEGPVGKRVIKYPIGVAVLEAPFYMAADLLAEPLGFAPDGYSRIYQWAICRSAIVYLLLGLFFLWQIGRRHADVEPLIAALTITVFGTNLFHYVTFDASFSHVYTFFSFALLVWVLQRYGGQPSLRRALLVGAAVGLVALIRIPNGLLAAIFVTGFLWQKVWQKKIARQTLMRALPLMTGVALLVVAPQFIYLKLAGGSFFFNAYRVLGEGFTLWKKPAIYYVLFSFERGLFVTAPFFALTVAVLFGSMFYQKFSFARLGLLVTFAVQVYILAAWWMPGLGGGFFHRGFIDLYPLLFLPLVQICQWAYTRNWSRGLLALGLLLCCFYMAKMMKGYWDGRLPFADPTWIQFKSVLLGNKL